MVFGNIKQDFSGVFDEWHKPVKKLSGGKEPKISYTAKNGKVCKVNFQQKFIDT